MTGLRESQHFAFAQRRNRHVEGVGKAGFRDVQVDQGGRLEAGQNLLLIQMDQMGKLPEYSADFFLLVTPQLDQTVVQLDCLRWLDEKRAARVAAAMNDAGDAAALLAAQRQDHAVFM